MTDLPSFSFEIAKLELHSGDILVVAFTDHYAQRDMDITIGFIREALPPGIGIITLCNGTKISIIRSQTEA